MIQFACFTLFSGLTTNPNQGKNNRVPSRRPLVPPKLRNANPNPPQDRLSSSDSGGSLQHPLRKPSHHPSNQEKSLPINGYSTWNR